MTWREANFVIAHGPQDRQEAWHLTVMALRSPGLRKPFSMGQAELSRLARSDPRVTKRALERLLRAGWLEIVRAGNPARATVWRLDTPQGYAHLWTSSSTGLLTAQNACQGGNSDLRNRADTLPFRTKEDRTKEESGRGPETRVGRSVVHTGRGPRPVGCRECQGSTWALNEAGEAYPCPNCDGTGTEKSGDQREGMGAT